MIFTHERSEVFMARGFHILRGIFLFTSSRQAVIRASTSTSKKTSVLWNVDVLGFGWGSNLYGLIVYTGVCMDCGLC